MTYHVESFYDNQTSTFTHVVVDESTKQCAVIDSVLDYDQDAAKFSTTNADKVIAYIKGKGLTNQWLLETHIHADHITGAFYLKQHIGGKTAIGTGIKKVLETWVPLFETEGDTPLTGDQFDQLFADGDTFKIGNLNVRVMHTPGHTPACATYVVEDEVAFVGDTIFNPNLGTARCDFPGGSAHDLYQSIQKLYALGDDVVLYLCHDYPKGDDKPLVKISVADQKNQNIMLDAQTSEADYINRREARDKTLAVPKLLLPSIQTNMRLGSFGPKHANGIQYIKIPINVL
ncbi:MAG: MBL fold metallo-hydrolase [Magnetococcales bacterium]|nr:MBL fold metallo-hydrolase [Magnetococcales bacterium]|tara:strand:- start:58647 stop:59510 length:864 start_codon:yes stop_codon:yes gene_type:complete